MRNRKRISIRNLLLLCTLPIMAIFLVLIVYFSNRSYRELLLSEFIEKQRQSTLYIGNTIGQTVQSVKTLARATSNNAVIIKNINQYLATHNEMTSSQKLSFLRNMDQNLSTVAYSNERVVSVNVLIQGLDPVSTTINGAFSYDSYLSPENREIVLNSMGIWLPTRKNDLPVHTYAPHIFSYVRRIYSDLYIGEPIGHLVINMDERLLLEIILEINSTQQETVLLLDSNRQIISSTDRLVVGLPMEQTGYAFLSGLLDTAQQSAMISDVIVSTAEVEESNGWKLVSIANYKNVVQPIENTTWNVVSTSAMIILIFSVLITLIAFIISRPIVALSRYTARLQNHEDFTMRIPERSKIAEIDYLYSKYNEMMSQIDQLIRQLYRNEALKRRKEFEVLQEQINPHFLYNTLESVNWMAINQGNQAISQVVIQLGNFLRLSLNKGKSIYRVSDEISHLQSYVNIQNVRSGDGIEYICRIEDGMPDKQMLKLILQPLVENSILHGFSSCEGRGAIRVQGVLDGDDMVFTVTDNGCGITAERLRQIEDPNSDVGHGILNVDTRIKLYHGTRYGLSIQSDGTGTCVTVRLPTRISDPDGRFSIKEEEDVSTGTGR